MCHARHTQLSQQAQRLRLQKKTRVKQASQITHSQTPSWHCNILCSSCSFLPGVFYSLLAGFLQTHLVCSAPSPSPPTSPPVLLSAKFPSWTLSPFALSGHPRPLAHPDRVPPRPPHGVAHQLKASPQSLLESSEGGCGLQPCTLPLPGGSFPSLHPAAPFLQLGFNFFKQQKLKTLCRAWLQARSGEVTCRITHVASRPHPRGCCCGVAGHSKVVLGCLARGPASQHDAVWHTRIGQSPSPGRGCRGRVAPGWGCARASCCCWPPPRARAAVRSNSV